MTPLLRVLAIIVAAAAAFGLAYGLGSGQAARLLSADDHDGGHPVHEFEPYDDDHGQPVAQWLGLRAQDAREIHQHDPAFARDLHRLRNDLTAARTSLARLFDRGADDAAIRAAIEKAIAAHNALERRVADHLLTIRHHLTPAQQKQLFSLAAESLQAEDED